MYSEGDVSFQNKAQLIYNWCKKDSRGSSLNCSYARNGRRSRQGAVAGWWVLMIENNDNVKAQAISRKYEHLLELNN